MGKWDKYLISETPPNVFHPETRNRESDFPWVNYPISIDREVFGRVPSAFWLEPNMVMRPSKREPGQGWPHKHDFDEYLVFLSIDDDNMSDLGGVVEFWMGGEKHIITKSTAVFIPRGIYHDPLFIHKVDRPFLFIGIGNTLKYTRSGYEGDPEYADSSTGKWDQNFITETRPSLVHPESRQRDNRLTFVNYPICINEECDGKVPGAFWLDPNIVIRPRLGQRISGGMMSHAYDEYLLFLSLNPNNLSDLGGKTSVLIEGEEHVITKTTAFFIPAGIYHAALGTTRVDRPFANIGIANTLKEDMISTVDDLKDAGAPAFTYGETAEVSFGGKKYQVNRCHLEYIQWFIERNRKLRP